MIEAKYFRAWLAFLVLQALGIAFTTATNTNAVLFLQPIDNFGKRIFALTMILTAVIRLALVKCFDNFDLHVLHIIISGAITAHSLLEIFYFKVFQASPAAALCSLLNGITTLIFSMYLFHLGEDPKLKEQPRRSGRLFAKHYMEANILNPPDTPNVRELKKRI